jgi:hypothetical protein
MRKISWLLSPTAHALARSALAKALEINRSANRCSVTLTFEMLALREGFATLI